VGNERNEVCTRKGDGGVGKVRQQRRAATKAGVSYLGTGKKWKKEERTGAKTPEIKGKGPVGGGSFDTTKVVTQ